MEGIVKGRNTRYDDTRVVRERNFDNSTHPNKFNNNRTIYS